MWATVKSRAKSGHKVKRESESFKTFRVFLNLQSRMLAKVEEVFWEAVLNHLSKLMHPETDLYNLQSNIDHKINEKIVADHLEMKIKVLFP